MISLSWMVASVVLSARGQLKFQKSVLHVDKQQGVLHLGLGHQLVPDRIRTSYSQSGDGASSDCFWLKSVLQVCDTDRDITILPSVSGVAVSG